MGWGEKYKEWMEQTEKKLEELHLTNHMLSVVVLDVLITSFSALQYVTVFCLWHI